MARERKNATQAWLEKWNPLQGLSIREAQNIFDVARAGDTQRLHWLFQEIEATNPVLLVCVERRAAALANFQWRVSEISASDGALSAEQKDAAERFLHGIENLPDALEHLDLAFFRGFAHVQPIWDADGGVKEISLLDSWKFVRSGGEWYYNPECTALAGALQPTSDCRLLSVVRRRPIDYPALAIHIRHAIGSRDWGRFLERYALPKPAVFMHPGANEKQRDEYLDGAQAVENGQVSVWPNGASLTDFAGGSRGTDPFDTFINHQEKQILLLATGGTLMSLAESGSGTLAGGAQAEVWESIVARDSGVIASAVQRDMLAPFLRRAFPGRPVAVKFEFDFTRPPTPKEIFEVAALARQAGWKIDQSELEEQTGYTLIPEQPTAAEPSAPATPFFNKSATSGEVGASRATAAQEAFAAALADEMAEAMAKEMANSITNKTDANGMEHADDSGQFAEKGGDAPAAPKKDAGVAYAAGHQAQVGQSGDWKTLGLPAMRDIAPDPAISKNTVSEARARVSAGIKMTNPLGESLTLDNSTLNHWRKKKHSGKDIEDRLSHLDAAIETFENPHEIWYSPEGKKMLYVRITELAPGRKVINAVEDTRDKGGYLSWHTNDTRYDYYREGKLLYVRK